MMNSCRSPADARTLDYAPRDIGATKNNKTAVAAVGLLSFNSGFWGTGHRYHQHLRLFDHYRRFCRLLSEKPKTSALERYLDASLWSVAPHSGVFWSCNVEALTDETPDNSAVCCWLPQLW